MTDLMNVTNNLISQYSFKKGDLVDGTIINWLPIIICGKYNKTLGLSDEGKWVIAGNEKLVPITNKSFVYLISILESSYSEVICELRKFDSEINGVSLLSVFPFVDIVKSGLEQTSDYWVEYALSWYSKFNEQQKEQLKTSLEIAMSSKRLSQQTRHKIKKLI